MVPHHPFRVTPLIIDIVAVKSGGWCKLKIFTCKIAVIQTKYI